ncbi:MAG: NAD(P)H-dependent oxidoreductase [Gammaproteobacteria bacterium]|nr:NAD(P)H-dependent oxidoreductase [Gammaproteobacteria bacterium]
MNPPKILAFAGSTRSGSFNKKLIRTAAQMVADTGAEVTQIDLRDYPMPLYDGDLESEHGLPENAKKLKQLMCEHHGFLIAAPEYNSSITGVLKNAIDWTSRPESDETPLIAYSGKVAALLAASPGGLGGLRTLVTVRMILGNLNMIVIPEQKAIPQSHQAFDEQENLKDDATRAAVELVVRHLVDVSKKLIV